MRPYFKGPLLVVCLALIPVIALVEVAIPLVIEACVDRGIVAQDLSQTAFYAGIFLALAIARYLTRTGQALISLLLVQRFVHQLRNRLVGHIMRLKSSYHESRVSGQLLTRATHDFDSIADSLNHGLLSSLVDFSLLVGSFASMIILDVRLGLIGGGFIDRKSVV